MLQVDPKSTLSSESYSEHNKKRHFGSALWILAIIGGMVAIIALAIANNLVAHNSAVVPTLPEPKPAASIGTAPSPAELSSSFREVARTVKPAVVFISVHEAVESSSSLQQLLPFDLPDPTPPRRRPGQGSGFIVTEDGFILTNNHVVSSADRIVVTLADGRSFRARLVGTDSETDLAVIKIDTGGLPIAILGNSDDVQQGDWVLALGSPFGLQQTLTAGIVSATGRQFQQFNQFIQTDASINPGNSGGPLVNMRGEVVGINSMIYSPAPAGGNVGIGFAVASNVARGIFGTLVKQGKVTRGYLGVSIRPIDAPIARAYGVEPESGALVTQAPEPDSPADKAGIRQGDVITGFDGQRVTSPRELTSVVAATPVGKTAQVQFVRAGQPQSVVVQVAERPSSARAPESGREPQDGNQPETAKLGITAQTVTPEMAEQMRLTEKTGALVRTVVAGSPAHDADLRHGDVIHRVDRSEIKTVEDLVGAVNSLRSGDEIAVLVERNRQMLFLTVTIP